METIRSVTLEDSDAIAEIYNYYIENTTVTFEEEPVTPNEIGRRIQDIVKSYPWYVCEDEGQVRGYAYLRAYHSRSAYRHSAEIGIYLRDGVTGRGIGTSLFEKLLDSVESLGIHVLVGGIALPNQASVAIHEKYGFEKVAHFKEVGRKFGQWIDVGHWQRVF